jgi:hypothetical protein
MKKYIEISEMHIETISELQLHFLIDINFEHVYMCTPNYMSDNFDYVIIPTVDSMHVK